MTQAWTTLTLKLRDLPQTCDDCLVEPEPLPKQPPGSAANSPIYRICSDWRRDAAVSKAYRKTLALLDEHTRQTLACCHVAGRIATTELSIEVANQNMRLTPNRAVLPTRWLLADSAGRVELQFDLKLGAKLANPLYRTALVLMDGAGQELFRLADTTSSTAERVFGASRGDWAMMRGKEVVARLTWLPARRGQPRGMRDWLRNLLATPDRGIVSFGERHVLTPPAALAMVALFNELTDSSS